jgi:general L-amino acid transport system ATP-binding protein
MKNNNNIIQIKDLNKWYGDFHVLNDINLDVKEGEIIVVCGPSGSGKSTLIRCINFLEQFQKGTIEVNGTNLTNDADKIIKLEHKFLWFFNTLTYFRI